MGTTPSLRYPTKNQYLSTAYAFWQNGWYKGNTILFTLRKTSHKVYTNSNILKGDGSLLRCLSKNKVTADALPPSIRYENIMRRTLVPNLHSPGSWQVSVSTSHCAAPILGSSCWFESLAEDVNLLRCYPIGRPHQRGKGWKRLPVWRYTEKTKKM